jgi:cation:H+ antiporter
VILDVLLLLGGIAVVVISADRMVLSSADLAARVGISPVIVGAVIIGFGTSLPELTVSLLALDQPDGLDLAVGNAIGSNIANISLILAISVIAFPFGDQSRVIKREGLLMLVALALSSFFLWDGDLDFYEGLLLLTGLGISALAVVSWSRRDRSEVTDGVDDARTERATWLVMLTAVIALIALVVGARAMVVGAESIALEVGMSEGVVGLTILALGTSLPELGTVVAAGRRGRSDLVLGNVLGSNVFNSLGVLGAVGVVGPGSLVTGFRPDLVVMVAVAALAGVVAWTGDRLNRWEGVLLLSAYPAAIFLAL